MNMLDLMNKMTELSEAKSTNNAFTGNWKDTDDTKGKSIIHKGKYGTAYQGEPDDLSTDDTKKTKKVAPADGEKRGRGRPAKGSDSSGKTTSHDTQSLSNFMIGNKPSKAVDKLPKTKSKTLKDWFERLDTALNEDGQFTVKPAAPGASDIMGPDGKKIGTASTPAAAQAVKNGEVNFDKEQGMAEGEGFSGAVEQKVKKALLRHYGKGTVTFSKTSNGGYFARHEDDLFGDTHSHQYDPETGKIDSAHSSSQYNEEGMAEGDIGKHNNATTGFAALVKKLTPKYGVKGAMRIAGSQLKKIKEADMPPNDSLLSPMSEGGKKGVNPFAKKDATDKKKCPPMSHVKKMCQDGKSVAEICKMHPDCDRAELKQMIADCKKKLSEGQLDELSKDTLKSYLKKSTGRADKFHKQGMEQDDDEEASPYFDKRENVSQARRGARDRLKGVFHPKEAPYGMAEGAKPDFLDLDKDGNKKEPMKKAVADKKAGPKKGVNPFAKKKISEGKVKEIAIDLKEMTPAEFKKKYKMTKAEMEKNMNTDTNDNKKDVTKGSLNELSSNTLSSYGKKAEKSNDKKLDKAAGHSEKATNLYSKGTSSAVAKSFDHEDKANKLHNQVNKRNDSMDQAAGKLKKQMSKGMMEGVRHSDAAHLRGKAHAMGGENYNCRYTPGTNEANMYHMGFKEGLDECYGQMPMESYVEEEFTPEGEVENMQLMTDESPMMDESPFSWAAKNTPTGKHFRLAGHDFTKTAAESMSMNPFMESLDKQLNALLNDDINEGMTVSISKGQQGTPDSVSVSAQDSEAEQLLSIIKSAGLGLFGGDNDSSDEPSSAMSMPGVSIADGGAELDSNINVVNDHDGMLDLIRKMTGQGPAQSDDNDYESEEHEHSHDEEECGDCGNNPCDCETIDEAETPDQAEFMATEDNAPDSGAQETTADENAEAAEDGAIAKSDQQNPTVTTNEDEMEEDLNESYANSAENTFEADIEFMTKVITGGLNKQKSTGQSTIPVVASQKNRLGEPMQESTALLHDWKKLSGIT